MFGGSLTPILTFGMTGCLGLWLEIWDSHVRFRTNLQGVFFLFSDLHPKKGDMNFVNHDVSKDSHTQNQTKDAEFGGFRHVTCHLRWP